MRLPGVRLPIERTLFTRGFTKGGCSADGDTTLTGGLFVEPTVRVSTSWGFTGLRRASFSATLTERAELALVAALTGSCKADFRTPSVTALTFAVPVGPVPVPVTAKIGAHVRLEAEGKVAASAGVRQNFELTGGLSYGRGKLKTISRAKTDFSVDAPQVGSFEGTATLRAGPRLTLEVAGAAGASLAVDGRLDLEVTPLKDPLWALYGGVDINGGLNLFGLRKDADIFSYRLPDPIASSRGGGFAETPPQLAVPPPAIRGEGRVFPRPNLGAPPLDTLPHETPVTLVCAIKGPPVAGLVGSSDVWYGLDDGSFVNAADVAGTAAVPALPACALPRAPRTAPRRTPPPPPAVRDADGDGIADADDRCPLVPGVPPRGCPRARGLAPGPDDGYWLAAEDGGVFSFGAPFHGSLGGSPLNAPVVGIAANPATSAGYWLAGADGGVFSFDTGFHGSLAGGPPPAAPVVGIAARQTGLGYWLAGADGGVFAFGDAGFHGSLPGLGVTPNAPIVGMAARPSGDGYWLAGADGGVFSFGGAGYHGGLVGGPPLNAPIVGMAATPSGGGYWLVGADGGVFAFGDAGFHGSLAGTLVNQPIVGMAATPSGNGYRLLGGDGGVFAFGDAVYRGGTA